MAVGPAATKPPDLLITVTGLRMFAKVAVVASPVLRVAPPAKVIAPVIGIAEACGDMSPQLKSPAPRMPKIVFEVIFIIVFVGLG